MRFLGLAMIVCIYLRDFLLLLAYECEEFFFKGDIKENVARL